MNMLDKLEALEERFAFVSEKISDPEVIADQDSWRKYCKEHSDLTPIIDKYREGHKMYNCPQNAITNEVSSSSINDLTKTRHCT